MIEDLRLKIEESSAEIFRLSLRQINQIVFSPNKSNSFAETILIVEKSPIRK